MKKSVFIYVMVFFTGTNNTCSLFEFTKENPWIQNKVFPHEVKCLILHTYYHMQTLPEFLRIRLICRETNRLCIQNTKLIERIAHDILSNQNSFVRQCMWNKIQYPGKSVSEILQNVLQTGAMYGSLPALYYISTSYNPFSVLDLCLLGSFFLDFPCFFFFLGGMSFPVLLYIKQCKIHYSGSGNVTQLLSRLKKISFKARELLFLKKIKIAEIPNHDNGQQYVLLPSLLRNMLPSLLFYPGSQLLRLVREELTDETLTKQIKTSFGKILCERVYSFHHETSDSTAHIIELDFQEDPLSLKQCVLIDLQTATIKNLLAENLDQYKQSCMQAIKQQCKKRYVPGTMLFVTTTFPENEMHNFHMHDMIFSLLSALKKNGYRILYNTHTALPTSPEFDTAYFGAAPISTQDGILLQKMYDFRSIKHDLDQYSFSLENIS